MKAVFWNGSVFKDYTVLKIVIHSFKVFETISFPLDHEYNFTNNRHMYMCLYIYSTPFKTTFNLPVFQGLFHIFVL